MGSNPGQLAHFLGKGWIGQIGRSVSRRLQVRMDRFRGADDPDTASPGSSQGLLGSCRIRAALLFQRSSLYPVLSALDDGEIIAAEDLRAVVPQYMQFRARALIAQDVRGYCIP